MNFKLQPPSIILFRPPSPPSLCSPKIKLDSDTTLGSEARHEGDIPEWKLQPKLSYDDDEDDR